MFLLLLGCSEGSAEIPDKPNTNTKQEESQRSGPDTPDGFELEIIDAPHYLLRFIAPESFSAGTIYGASPVPHHGNMQLITMHKTRTSVLRKRQPTKRCANGTGIRAIREYANFFRCTPAVSTLCGTTSYRST